MALSFEMWFFSYEAFIHFGVLRKLCVS